MRTLFGKPVLGVPMPGGKVADYLIEGVTPADPRASREWRLTSPRGAVHTVTELPGSWRCTCPASTRYTRHGRTHAVGSALHCKHVARLVTFLEESAGGRANDRRAGQRLSVGRGGVRLPAVVGADDPPARGLGRLPAAHPDVRPDAGVELEGRTVLVAAGGVAAPAAEAAHQEAGRRPDVATAGPDVAKSQTARNAHLIGAAVVP